MNYQSTSVVLPTDINAIAPGFQDRIELREEVESEVIRLRQKHDLWNVYSPEWELYLSSYEGGPDFANAANLHKHLRESQEDFYGRVQRIHYINYCEQLVDFFTNFIFSEPIQRDGGTNNSFYQDFIKNVNRKNDSIDAYMRMVSDDMQIFGMSYTLIDMPKVNIAENTVFTEQAREDLNINPYWVLIKPPEIIDWIVDDFETFSYIRRCQFTSQLEGSELHRYEKYTEWYTDLVKVTYVDVTNEGKPYIAQHLSEESPNPFGIIPIKICRYKRSKKYPLMGNSFLRDFSYNNREIMNYTSLIQEFLYRQCFNILAKESDTTIPLRDQNDGVWGTSNILEYPRGAAAPAYITPPVDPAKFLQDERSKITTEMFIRAAQSAMSELFNGSKSSGFSQSQTFFKTVPFISSRADSLEAHEQAVLELTFSLINKEWDGTVKYKDRYELTSITDVITQLTSLFRDLAFPSETFIKNELKRLVPTVDNKLSVDDLNTIIKEIDNMDFKEWQDIQKLALIGKAGSSPAMQQKSKQTGGIDEVIKESKGPNVAATNKLKT